MPMDPIVFSLATAAIFAVTASILMWPAARRDEGERIPVRAMPRAVRSRRSSF